MDVKTERANEAASVGGDQFVDDIPSDDELLRLFPSTPQFPHRSMRVGYALYLWMTVAAGDGGIAPLESMTLNGYVPAEYWIDDARRHCRTTLTLFNCHGAIEEMPDAVAALDGLRSLVMVRNRRLAVLPESLSRLAPSLTHLNVAANALTALPEAVGDLTRLQSLVLGQRGWVGCGGPSKPGISALPASLANCRRLTLLDLSNQRFGSIPDEVYSLTNLTSLAMARTGLAGPLPEAVTVLGSLATLDLSSNAVTGVNPTVANLTALTVLDLSGNPIDRLPWSVSRMSALTFLGVDGAPLAGIAASAGDQTGGEEEEEEERDGSGDNGGGGYCYEASSDMDYVLAGAPMAVTAAGAMDATPTDAASRFARLAAPSNEPALVVEAHFGAVAAEASGWFAVMRLLTNPLTVIAAADGGGRAAKRTRFR